MRRTGSPPPGKPTALAALGLGHPGWRGWRTRGADCRGDEVLARLSAVGGVVLLADTTLTPTQANNSEHPRHDQRQNMLICRNFANYRKPLGTQQGLRLFLVQGCYFLWGGPWGLGCVGHVEGHERPPEGLVKCLMQDSMDLLHRGRREPTVQPVAIEALDVRGS